MSDDLLKYLDPKVLSNGPRAWLPLRGKPRHPALCLTIIIAVVTLPGCSRGRQGSAGGEPANEFDRHVRAGHHPALVRAYLKLRDGDTVEWFAPQAVPSVREVTSVRSDRPSMWEAVGGPAVLSAGETTLAPEGHVLMENVLVERAGQHETYLSPPSETVVMTCAAMSGRCEVVGDSIHIKIFHVTFQTVYSVGTPRENVVVGSWPETGFVIDIADFDQ